MVDSTQESDAILSAANRSLQVQRDGGTHRPAKSIGRGSAQLKAQTWKKRIKRILIAFAGIWAAAVAIGLIIDGIGFTGIMLTVLAAVVAAGAFAATPLASSGRPESASTRPASSILNRFRVNSGPS